MARPMRGEVLALREKEFVEAAVAQGAGPLRVMFGELLPNLWSTIIVFFTLNIANNMLLEAALSFLGAGVQPPNSSWGTMISNGVELLYSAPLLSDRPRADDPAHGALAEHPRRRPARRARPEVEGAGSRPTPARYEPEGADGLMARFVVRRLLGMVAGPLRDLGDRLPDLQRDPQLRPGAADRGQERDAAADRRTSTRNGASTSRCRSAVPDDDGEDLHRRADLLREPARRRRTDRRGDPGDPLALHRRRDDLDVLRARSSATSRRCGPVA